jgi:hypothetical protein
MIKAKYSAAITDKPWWLAGGIPRDACVAAYQPVGASDYAASKINLASPGLHNVTDGAAYPTWNVNSGWIGAGNPNQYLITDIYPKTTWSAIVRFSNAVAYTDVTMSLFGCEESTSKRFEILPVRSLPLTNKGVIYGVGGYVIVEPTCYGGVLAIAGQSAYRDGNLDGVINAGTDPTVPLSIFARNTGSVTGFLKGYIQALAFYSTVLSASQIAALTNAMNAL